LRKIHLRWVPHALSPNQKSERVSDSRLLLAALAHNGATLFQAVITGDESRFFLSYPRDSMWASSRDDIPDRMKQPIATEKCLISVLWSVRGIHSLIDVPKGTTYNTDVFCNEVMPSLKRDIASRGRREMSR
jgi:hypothetical protein